MSDRIICPVCGTPNAPDDLFCGNCGSSLASAAAADPAYGAAADAPTPGAPDTPGASDTLTPPLAGQAMVTCTNCGTANPPERTFCLRCGTQLPSADAASTGAGSTTGMVTAGLPTTAADAGIAAGEAEGGRRPLMVGASLVAGAFVILVGIAVVMIFLGSSDGGPGTAASSPESSPRSSPSGSPRASTAPSPPAETTPPPTATPRSRPTPTPTPRPTPPPDPPSRAALESDLLNRASFLRCERFRQPDQPFDHGARAAIRCGAPAARLRQLALFTFPSPGDTEDYWSVRMASIEPPPAENEDACTGGAVGQTRWGFGQLACYLDGGSAELRWTDERTAMYGVLDATDADVVALYSWWRTNGRRLGRPLTASLEPVPVPTSLTAGPALGAPSAFVCGEDGASATDALDRRWRLVRVTFRTSSAYERVILHLERTGTGGPAYEATARVSGFPAADVALHAPELEAPHAGRTAIVVRLGNGVTDSARLSHYVPNGMRTVTELSTYRLPDGTAAALIGSSGEPCYQLRVPQWRAGATGSADVADVYIDIRR